jgi:hypothetical protein
MCERLSRILCSGMIWWYWTKYCRRHVVKTMASRSEYQSILVRWIRNAPNLRNPADPTYHSEPSRHYYRGVIKARFVGSTCDIELLTYRAKSEACSINRWEGKVETWKRPILPIYHNLEGQSGILHIEATEWFPGSICRYKSLRGSSHLVRTLKCIVWGLSREPESNLSHNQTRIERFFFPA